LNQIRLENVAYRFPGSKRSAVDGVGFCWIEGEIIGLVGLSGAGKSTLGRLIKGLLDPSAGQIRFVQDNAPHRSDSSLLMRKVGWADARPERQFFAETVCEEVGFGPQNYGLTGAELDERVAVTLKLLGMEPEAFLERDPSTLSGGEKRRAALASTLAIGYPFYVLDDPAAGLDDIGLQSIRLLIRSLSEQGVGVMVIGHDLTLLSPGTTRLLRMSEGRLIGDHPPGTWDSKEITSWLAAINPIPPDAISPD
jgi:energy-coupling factor transporter ATP-binding protein EcfA2